MMGLRRLGWCAQGWAFVGWFLLASVCGAASLEVRVEPQTIYLGDSFLLQVIWSGVGSPKGRPELNPKTGYSVQGPHEQKSSQTFVKIVNGAHERQVTEHVAWVYQIEPEHAGTFKMAPVRLEVDGKRFTADVPAVDVRGMEPQPYVRVQLESNQTNVIINETFEVDYVVTLARLPKPFDGIVPIEKGRVSPLLECALMMDGFNLQGAIPIRAYEAILQSYLVQSDDVPGFRINDLKVNTTASPFDFFAQPHVARFKLPSREVNWKGQPAFEFRLKLAFRATELGTCRFPMMRFKGTCLKMREDGKDVESVAVYTSSTGLSVEVVLPPETGRPESFMGVVANALKATVDLDAQVCQEGDPVQLTLTLTGDEMLENMKRQIEPPDLWKNEAMGERFRRYGEVETEYIPAGVRYTYKVRPLVSGTIEIPAFEFAFFNATTRAYETVSSIPVPLRVNPGLHLDLDTFGTESEDGGGTELLMPQKRTVAGMTMQMGPERDALPALWCVRHGWRGLLLPPVIYGMVALVVGLWHRRRHYGTQWRRTSAKSRAVRRILRAKTPQAIRTAVGMVLKDKFGAEGMNFTPPEVEERLKANGIAEDVAAAVRNHLQQVYDSAFTPGGDPNAVVKAHRGALAELFSSLKGLILAGLLGSLLGEAHASEAVGAPDDSFAWRQAAAQVAVAKTPDAFREVAKVYRELLKERPNDTAVLANYATSLLLAGMPNEAVQVWVRLEALEGANFETENNLALAYETIRKRAQDALAPDTDATAEMRVERGLSSDLPWYRTPLFWHYRVPLHSRLDGLLAAWALLWAGLLLRRLGLRRLGAWIAGLGGALTLLLGVSVGVSGSVLSRTIPEVPETVASMEEVTK